jgi:hypothetical protein
MGLAKDDLVLEVGHDSDCDSTLRDQIMSITGTTFLEGSTNEVVDAVIIWWRDGDGDLVDELMDALTYLVENGAISRCRTYCRTQCDFHNRARKGLDRDSISGT